MMPHWTANTIKIDQYQTVELSLEIQRPIAFLIATNRSFEFEQFLLTLEQSLESSSILNRNKSKPLLHLYLSTTKSLKPNLNRVHLEWIAIHWKPFEELERNNISKVRIQQIELSKMACKELENPILVVMDDDLTFDALIQENGEILTGFPFSYVHEIYNFAEEHPCDIALGGVTGSPPLPGTSSQRTFLQDFLASSSSVNQSEKRWTEKDYYYDLSESRTLWGAWPMAKINQDNNQPVLNALNEMFHVGPSSRPLIYQSQQEPPRTRLIRGGNTVVFTPKYITNIPHPDIRRRGDSLWAILAAEHGAKILQFSYPLYHHRDYNSVTVSTLCQRMNDDLYGAALQRAMLSSEDSFDEIYNERVKLQLSLLNESSKLLKQALQYVDSEDQTSGFWNLTIKERQDFVKSSMNILSKLSHSIKKVQNRQNQINKGANFFMKAIRYDAIKAMEADI